MKDLSHNKEKRVKTSLNELTTNMANFYYYFASFWDNFSSQKIIEDEAKLSN
jgi:hypothetical protein